MIRNEQKWPKIEAGNQCEVHIANGKANKSTKLAEDLWWNHVDTEQPQRHNIDQSPQTSFGTEGESNSSCHGKSLNSLKSLISKFT